VLQTEGKNEQGGEQVCFYFLSREEIKLVEGPVVNKKEMDLGKSEKKNRSVSIGRKPSIVASKV